LQNVTSFAFGSFAQVFLFARGTLSLLLLPVVALSPQSLSDSSSLSQIRGALIYYVLNFHKLTPAESCLPLRLFVRNFSSLR
jgi:hypothetical protein